MYGTKQPSVYTKGLWRLNDNGNDISGNEYNVADTGSDITFTTYGPYGTCATKPDEDLHSILQGYHDVLGSEAQYCTISFWCKINGYRAANGTTTMCGIVSKATRRSYYFRATSTAMIVGCFDKTGPNENDGHYHEGSFTYDYNRGSWHMYTYVIDNYVCSTYLDALKVYSYDLTAPNGTYAFKVNSIAICGANIRGMSAGCSAPLIGSISEFFIENKVWSELEIKRYYTYAKGRYNPKIS